MRIAIPFLASLVLSLPSHAVVGNLFRAYLSVGGNDANPCTLAQPCRLLPAALNAVAPGGEVWMLDSANYNSAPVTITQSVTILAVPGVIGSVVATAGGVAAIGVPTDGLDVTLRNLVVTALPSATGTTIGVLLNSASHLTLEDCDISNLTDGARVQAGGTLTMVRGMLRGHSGNGLLVSSASAATIDGTKFIRNGIGLNSTNFTGGGPTKVSVSDALFSANGIGIQAFSTGDINTTKENRVFVDRSTIVLSTTRGINAFSTANGGAESFVVLNGSRMSLNQQGFSATGSSAVYSTGNNIVYNEFLSSVPPSPTALPPN